VSLYIWEELEFGSILGALPLPFEISRVALEFLKLFFIDINEGSSQPSDQSPL